MSPATIASDALLKMLYSSLVAGVAITVVFSIAMFGAIRSSDMRRARRPNAAVGYAVLSAFGLLASAAIVVYGLMLVAHKS
jgi:hypothetical protein